MNNLWRLQKYCCEDISLIENYEEAMNDTEHRWVCHHRLETHNSDGSIRLVGISKAEWIALGMYYNRPASELVFMKNSDHTILHKKGKPSGNKGIHRSEELKRQISEKLKGRPSPMKGRPGSMKGRHHSEETKRKIAEAKSRITEETRRKLSEAAKRRWSK